MKTYKERTASILEKAKAQRKKNTIIRSSIGITLCMAVVFLSVVLFTPYDTAPPSVEQYAASEYYSIIQKMNALTYAKPEYKNPFEKYILSNAENFFSSFLLNSQAEGILDSVPEADYNASLSDGDDSQKYEETTDNQVAGIIEGDRFKRSDKYIYYIKGDKLAVYSIEGADSKEIGAYTITDGNGYKLSAYQDEWEIFLSSDCRTLTLVSSAYHSDSGQKYVALVNIDVSNPAQIKETHRTYLTGSYLSARMAGEDILLMAHYNVRWSDIDFDNADTFIPMYGTIENMAYIDSSNIIAPDELTNTSYTVVCKIAAATLEAKSTGAFLSYADEVYVSEDKIYASRSYLQETADSKESDEYSLSEYMTEISAMTYGGEKLEPAGSVHIKGHLENQYSMDEYEGVLRVVTTTETIRNYHYTAFSSDIVTSDIASVETNASLYCIDINTWEVVGSVEQFAPAGETVRSVRFDKDKAYVCTAVQLTDPVFSFDLSDLNNITVKDTGTITGYSISLVNFGDYLLGIGYGDTMDTLKIELYQETPTGVESVCTYEAQGCGFSREYKSYLIDREHMQIGLGVHLYDYSLPDNTMQDCYILLQFDGYDFIELVKEPVTGENSYKRAVIIDGYIYMFGENFIVKEI